MSPIDMAPCPQSSSPPTEPGGAGAGTSGLAGAAPLRRNLDRLGRDAQLLALHGAAFLETPL
eukprot:5864785-Prymnesium_polylepis.1